MKSKLREYLKTVQEQQVQCKVSNFIIEVTQNDNFRVIIDYVEDEIRKNKYFDFYEDDDENSKEKIKEIKTIIRNQYYKP